MIDNYDSFTYNLVQYLAELGADVKVFRNDEITVDEAVELNPSKVVISPGPCYPEDAGVSMQMVRHFAGKVPVLGVCLGHQSVVRAFGGDIVRSGRIMHGKTSMIHHDGKTIYRGLPEPFEANRYHSLIVDRSTLPDCFEISSWTDMDEIMGVRHKEFPVEGVQFHPESILSITGMDLLKNFLEVKI